MVGERDWRGQLETIRGLVYSPGAGSVEPADRVKGEEQTYITTHIWNFCSEIKQSKHISPDKRPHLF